MCTLNLQQYLFLIVFIYSQYLAYKKYIFVYKINNTTIPGVKYSYTGYIWNMLFLIEQERKIDVFVISKQAKVHFLIKY